MGGFLGLLFQEKVKISAIPLNYEKSISFHIGDLRCIDSVQFMGSSLDDLTGTFVKRMNTNYERGVRQNYELVCHKGFHPHEWVDGLDKLKTTGVFHPERYFTLG